MNETLFRAGYGAYRAADLPLVHHNRSRTTIHLLRHHLSRGRAQVQFIEGDHPTDESRARARAFLRGYPSRRLGRIDASVEAWGGELRPRYRRVRPLVRLGVLSAWLGGHLELRRPSRPGRPHHAPGGAEPAGPAGATERPVVPSTPLTRPLRLVGASAAAHHGSRAVFVHLPKTAGSTLLRILEREYEGHPTFRVYADSEARIADLRAMSDDQRSRLRLVVGHMAVGIDRFLPGANAYLTMLRDPVERIVSHYHYVLAHPQGAGNARAVEGISSLDEYVRSSVFARIVNNGQTRLLGSDVLAAGEPADADALERAKAFLDRPDVVVGVQERFDESLLVMVQAFGWGLPAYRRENVTASRPRIAELAPATVELIRERNALDIELHAHATARFERALADVDDVEGRLSDLRLAGRWLDPGT